MKFHATLSLCVFAIAATVQAQGTDTPYHLVATVALPGVQGGFDHFAYDARVHRLFLAASDNGTVEVIDTDKHSSVSSIHGFVNPHSIIVRRAKDDILVTDSGPNSSALISESSLKKLRTVAVASGANCVLPSADGKHLYVTAGGDRVGETDSALQTVNLETAAVTTTVRVPALHLQPMALDAHRQHLLVNVADQDTIALFDPKTLKRVGSWPIPKGHKNSPIVFDTKEDALFVVSSDPGILMSLDPRSGALRTSIETPPNPDDMGFDPVRQRLFVPGEGALNIYQIGKGASLQLLQHLPTGDGARTGVFLPSMNAFAVAVPSTATAPAKVLFFGGSK